MTIVNKFIANLKKPTKQNKNTQDMNKNELDWVKQTLGPQTLTSMYLEADHKKPSKLKYRGKNIKT